MKKTEAGKKLRPSDGPEKPGWVEVNVPTEYGDGSSFLRGRGNARRLKITYYKNTKDDAFMARVWFGPAAEGPPGYAHGGSIAAVCDEAMGLAVWLKGYRAVSAKIEIDYKKMLPLKTTAIVEMWVVQARGKKIVAKGRVRNEDGTVYSEARGLFVSIDPEKIKAFIESAMNARFISSEKQEKDSGAGHGCT